MGTTTLRRLALAGLLAVKSAAAAGLLANPGFEGVYQDLAECPNVTGQVAPGWSDNTCWDGSRPQIRYAPAPGAGIGGSVAQRIELVSGSRLQFAQFIGEVPPDMTVLRVRVSLKGRPGMAVRVTVRDVGPPYGIDGGTLVTLSPDWRAYTFEGVARGGAIGLFVTAGEPGTLWIDEAEVETAGSAAQVPVPPAGPVGADYFGMHFNALDTRWPATEPRIGATRIWDAGGPRDGQGEGGAQWADVQPAPGVFDWSGLDARVDRALRRGAGSLYVLGGRTPRWAAATPDVDSPYGPGQCAEPVDDRVWGGWVQAVATRYRGRIRHWELWNEADLPAFYCGRPERLIALARIARQVLKRIDPGNVLLSPGYSGPDAGGLDHFLRGGGGAQVDAIAFHFYVDRPEDLAARMHGVREVMARHGVAALPLWNTEQGFFDAEPPLDLYPPELGAALVARAHLLGWAWGHAHLFFYSWDNAFSRTPLSQPDTRRPTPASIALAQVQRWMIGRTVVACTLDADGNRTMTLRDADGRLGRVLWNADVAEGGSVPFTPPPEWGVRVAVDLAGRVAPVAGPVAAGAAPVLLLD